ncbi:HEAT repeat domain-containing protein [Streptomyces scabiei]|uniref:HEAT repeat domain-containing protein n=1 Tax=Streptomyces scabiei TaxID=1930 RepID=UPI0029A6A6B7|nr:HEAT repeat domain-containing protein [Streptomyces scabiei]MDX3522678.1 HEAT repeat domain-containing protein [Streptomyces scabiei]
MKVVRGGGAEGAAHQIRFFLRESAAEEPGRRAAAVKGLGRVGRWAAAYGEVVAGVGDAVVRAAQDPAAVVRAAAADALGRLGPAGGDGAGAVVVALMGDADPAVRRRASLAAERLGLTGPEVVAALRRLSQDTDRHLRINALLGLRVRGETPEPALLVRLLGDTESLVWGHARNALYPLLRDRPVRELLLRTARQGRGLSRVRALDMLPSKDLAGLRESLVEGLSDECPEVRGMSASKLSDEDGTRAVDAILSALAAETEPEAARQMLHTLGWRGEERVLPLAVRWLDHPDAGYTAVWTLARLDTSEAWEWIRTVVVSGPGSGSEPVPGRGHPEVRAAAAVALGERGAPRATALLVPLLRDPDERIRVGALRGLTGLGRHGRHGRLRRLRRERRAAAAALLALLTADGTVLRHTRNALSEYPEALPAVRRLIGHPSDEVRAAVVSLLDEDEEADVRLLLAHLHDPSEPVRYEALQGISRYVDGYGELPRDAHGLLGEIEALAHTPHSPSSPRSPRSPRSSATSFNIRLTAGRILDALGRRGTA